MMMEGMAMAPLTSFLAYQDFNSSSSPSPSYPFSFSPATPLPNQDGVEELKQKLMWTTMELESERISSREERRILEERIGELILLVKLTTQERDQARDHLQILKTKLNQFQSSSSSSPPPATAATVAAYGYSSLVRLGSPTPAKPNSGVTDSESLSGSPVDSFLDAAAVSSPEFSNGNVQDSRSNIQQIHLDCTASTIPMRIPTAITKFTDKATAAIEALAKKPLPEKGKLLQAVMDAGPLLNTLLVAGPLPKWRNPPPVQPLSIPPMIAAKNNNNNIAETNKLNSSVNAMLEFAGAGDDSGGLCLKTLTVKRKKT